MSKSTIAILVPIITGIFLIIVAWIENPKEEDTLSSTIQGEIISVGDNNTITKIEKQTINKSIGE